MLLVHHDASHCSIIQHRTSCIISLMHLCIMHASSAHYGDTGVKCIGNSVVLVTMYHCDGMFLLRVSRHPPVPSTLRNCSTVARSLKLRANRVSNGSKFFFSFDIPLFYFFVACLRNFPSTFTIIHWFSSSLSKPSMESDCFQSPEIFYGLSEMKKHCGPPPEDILNLSECHFRTIASMLQFQSKIVNTTTVTSALSNMPWPLDL